MNHTDASLRNNAHLLKFSRSKRPKGAGRASRSCHRSGTRGHCRLQYGAKYPLGEKIDYPPTPRPLAIVTITIHGMDPGGEKLAGKVFRSCSSCELQEGKFCVSMPVGRRGRRDWLFWFPLRFRSDDDFSWRDADDETVRQTATSCCRPYGRPGLKSWSDSQRIYPSRRHFKTGRELHPARHRVTGSPDLSRGTGCSKERCYCMKKGKSICG